MDRLGVQTSRVALLDGDQRSRQDESATAVLEWTINGVPLREIVGDPSSMSPLYVAADEDQRRELLLRLRGSRTDLPTFVPRFERSRLDRLLGRRGIPWAPFGPAFEDGRVVLLECPCGDLDCGALTTEVVVGDDVVEWRVIGWQVTYEPFAGFNAKVWSARFDRSQYVAVIDDVLAMDWSRLR
ncbi:MAG: hypothetical protein NTV28_08700 [Propionibacteriales bacterium]|nr:hypothetical protein [Propionibacteriales bacterium]